MQRADAVVIGAGPAGISAALQLSRRGHDVLLLDKVAFPRDKVCGEGLMPHGLAALEALGLADAVRRAGAVPFVGIRYTAGDWVAQGCFPGGKVGLGVRRLRVDGALLAACEAEPRLMVWPSTRAVSIERVDGAWQVDTTNGIVRAPLIIGADGLHSWTRRQLGLDGAARARRRYGVRSHWRLAAGISAPTHVEVFLLAGGVEVYITPVATDEVNIALLCERDAVRALSDDLLGGLLAQARSVDALRSLLDGAVPLNRPGVTGPLWQTPRDIVADGALLVGDAAGFLDALTGEGMSVGLASATAAAAVGGAALRRGDVSRQALRPYATQRRAAVRELELLTEIVVRGVRYRALAHRVVRQLARHPELFDQVLAVNVGAASVRSLGPRALLRLVGAA